jgi:hypothetical protein
VVRTVPCRGCTAVHDHHVDLVSRWACRAALRAPHVPLRGTASTGAADAVAAQQEVVAPGKVQRQTA